MSSVGGAVDTKEDLTRVKPKTLYYIRHGERLDEKKLALWEGIVRLIKHSRERNVKVSEIAQLRPDLTLVPIGRPDLALSAGLLSCLDKLYPVTSTRTILDIREDSILTPIKGVLRAQEKAIQLVRYFNDNQLVAPTEIYCSALIRAVETATVFSTEFNNIPIYVSQSLATSAASVNVGDVKTFHTISEIRSMFPSHHIYCCDEGVDVDGKNAHDGHIASVQTMAYSNTSEFRNSDVDSINRIISFGSDQNVIIVGHREGIRNLWDSEAAVNKIKRLPSILQYCEGNYSSLLIFYTFLLLTLIKFVAQVAKFKVDFNETLNKNRVIFSELLSSTLMDTDGMPDNGRITNLVEPEPMSCFGGLHEG